MDYVILIKWMSTTALGTTSMKGLKHHQSGTGHFSAHLTHIWPSPLFALCRTFSAR